MIPPSERLGFSSTPPLLQDVDCGDLLWLAFVFALAAAVVALRTV